MSEVAVGGFLEVAVILTERDAQIQKAGERVGQAAGNVHGWCIVRLKVPCFVHLYTFIFHLPSGGAAFRHHMIKYPQKQFSRKKVY